MSLRTRLILGYATLILLLGLAAGWGMRRLTADLDAALGETAASVGRSVFTVLRHERRALDAAGAEAKAEALAASQLEPEPRDGDDFRASNATRATETIRVVVDGRELAAHEVAARRALHAAHAEFELLPQGHGDATRLVLRGEGFAQAIPLPRSGVDAALERYTQRLGWGLAALLTLCLLGAAWLAQRIARPLRELATAAQSVGRGELGVQAPSGGVPEVRETIAAFNRMSAQLQLLDAEAAALRADRALAELGEIGRGLAHSLRNPLHALGLSLEALAAQAGDPARAQPLAQSGRQQLERVDQALRGFLALAAGSEASAAPLPLREVVDDVLLEASQRAQGRVRLQREGDDATLAAVAAEVRVMLHALVVNALEASPDGATVVVRTTRSGDAVVLEVDDEGAGVPESLRPRLFQPHVSGKPHGAGMGLYIAERLARLRYRGGIALHPRLPHGTSARLELRAREVLGG